MTQESFVRPPHFATWLVNLFTSNEQTESIPGDLLEEFSDVASKSGVASARRWYWRQSMRTIAHLYGSSFRSAPWVMATTVLGGILLAGFIPAWTYRALLVIVVENGVPVQRNIHFLGQWVQPGLLAIEIIEMMLVGCIVAMAAKGREITTTITLLMARISLFLIVLAWMVGHGKAGITPTHGILLAVLSLTLLIFERSCGIIVGGLIVRMSRSGAARRLSAA